jgi:hypothetical protein
VRNAPLDFYPFAQSDSRPPQKAKAKSKKQKAKSKKQKARSQAERSLDLDEYYGNDEQHHC